jgi:predicted transcriptional regulator
MASRRSKDQIVSRILSVCGGKGAGKTRIVYASNLNFLNANHYLDLLIENGLLESGHENAARYKTTRKGIELLERFRAIEELIPELGNHGGWQTPQGHVAIGEARLAVDAARKGPGQGYLELARKEVEKIG